MSNLTRKSPRLWTSFNFRTAARLTLKTAAGFLMLVFVSGCPPGPPSLPADAQDACTLSAATFASWFQSGSVSLNGVVNPANSLANLVPNCGFYQWSEQMFMWLTSPAPAAYGGGTHIFDSPTFYDVSPPDASGNRTFLPHTAGLIRAFALRAAQRGAHRLPVILDRSGTLREVEPPDPKVKPLVRDQSGRLLEIVHVRVENGRPVLLDKEGRVIAARHAENVSRAAEQKLPSNALMARKFVIDGFPIFLDPALAVIDVEQGQAGAADVLEAQTAANGSLVYYATMVNDVYAYFLTGFKKGGITTSPPNQFPTTAADLNNISAFATANGKPSPPFPDPNALAVEVKSSWVVAAGLPNLSSYITMTATIPTYDQSDPTHKSWPETGQQTVQLALAGMHVVGSTAGHPEMVWATFEHVGNTPLATYFYNSTTAPNQQVPQNTTGTWLFSADGATTPFNVSHMFFTGPPSNTIQVPTPCTVTADNPCTISPSNTLRTEPWGIDGSNAFSNTEVISTNNHVRGMMASGDVRANYIMTGATWTIGGAKPVGVTPGVGTNRMSNTTMETYQQGSNCFSCHQNFNPAVLLADTAVSHVFSALKPLF